MNFPKVDLTVQPKQGRLRIWPSVMDSTADRKDYSTDHQALPVEAAIKYSANSWNPRQRLQDAVCYERSINPKSFYKLRNGHR
jgi:hypothetical protein